MPEIKHQFTGGKMNKDLDERLVPNGEYRDAMNIQVSTSEGSDVGTVQNILGNSLIPNQGFVDSESFCVGSIADESNDALYWLVSGQNHSKDDFINGIVSNTITIPSYNKDLIIRSKGGETRPIVVDKHAALIDNYASNTLNDNFIVLPTANLFDITVGMSVMGIKSDGTTTSEDVKVESVDEVTNLVIPVELLKEVVVTPTDLIFDFSLGHLPLLAGSTATTSAPAPYIFITKDDWRLASTWGMVAGDPISFNLPGTSDLGVPSGTTVVGITPNYQFSFSDGTYADYTRIEVSNTIMNYSTTTVVTYNIIAGGFSTAHSIGFLDTGGTGSATITSDINVSQFSGQVLIPSTNPWSDNIEEGMLVNASIQYPSGGLLETITPVGGGYQIEIFDALTDTLIIPSATAAPYSDYLSFSLPATISLALGESLVQLSGNLDLTEAYDYLYFKGDRTLNFNKENLITGVNIIDDMLFWTDNHTEPKKINISKCIEGTDILGNKHTKLINNEVSGEVFLTEEHITVIKKAPTTPLSLDLKTSREEDVNYSGKITVSDDVATSSFTSTSSTMTDFNTLVVGDTFRVIVSEDLDQNSDFKLFETAGEPGKLWKEGTKVLLREYDDEEPPIVPISEYTIKGVVEAWAGNNFNSDNGDVKVSIKITSIDGFPPQAAAGTTLDYAIDVFEEEEKLFEFKFPRFSYRYKYQDGEYSAYAPFSEVAFSPGTFDYHPKKGYNLGMTNRIKSVLLKNFITQDIPGDVIEIDLLYKEDASPNVYVVDTIKPGSPPQIGEAFNHWNKNTYELNSDVIHSVLPSNQLLRPWDNVPKTALAQEVTGNRIVYGNYLQNYNLLGPNGNQFVPEFTHSLASIAPTNLSIKSIKSLRDYQLGVVFVDKYGRETPVISNPSGAFKVEKSKANLENRLVVGFRGTEANASIPNDFKYYKFFVKETSGEYYNMAMDRFYDAEDDNYWLAFPSSDRNKVDIDTVLILKKGPDSDELIQVPARYKILAIENEAPDFIKTSKYNIAQVSHNMLLGANSLAISDLFGNTGETAPLKGRDSFSMSAGPLESSSASNLHEIKDDLYVEFGLSGSGRTSDMYKITNVSKEGTTDFHFQLDRVLGEDVDFISSQSGNGQKILDLTQVRIYKHVVENKPNFDGRFFVKIYADDTFNSKVKVKAEADTPEYRVNASKRIFALKDNHVAIHTGEYNSNVYDDKDVRFNFAIHGNGMLGEGPMDSQVDSNRFKDAVSSGIYASFKAYYGNWIIDTKGFERSSIFELESANVSSANNYMPLRLEQATPASSAADLRSIERDFVVAIDNSDHRGSHVAKWKFRGNDAYGKSLGIRDFGSTEEGSMDLSFGSIQPPFFRTWKKSMAFWDLENRADDKYNFIKPLLKEINAGKQFRWKEDPSGTIYTVVKQVESYNRLNFTNKHNNDSYTEDWGDDNIPSSADRGRAYNRPYNYKLNKRFHFTPSMKDGWNPTGQLGAITGGKKVNYFYHTTQNAVQSLKASSAHPGGLSNTVLISKMHFEESLNGNELDSAGNPVSPQRIEVGMILTYVQSGSLPYPLLVKEINPIAGGASGYEIVFTGYQDINDKVTIAASKSLNFEQPTMNGLSIASARNISQYAGTTNGSIGAVGYTLEFIEPIVEEVLLPENPAVWETEPKESTDLDIYYEMSGNNPIKLDRHTIKTALPIGSKIEGLGGAGGGTPDMYIEYNSSVNGDTIVVSEDLDLTGENRVGANDMFKVTRADGVSLVISVVAVIDHTVYNQKSRTFKISKFLYNSDIQLTWHNCFSFGNGVESNRIRDNFNLPYMSNGVKASTTLDGEYKEEHRKYGLIFSGIYNSISGINNLNQFIAAEKITKDINPIYGSIQKLHSRDSDLIALCEDKCLRILANKDAIYNADGNPQLTANQNVLGQTIPFSGEFGISTNPESFASESYRVYFADKVRGAIMRLSKDGLTPISDHGMKDWFKDNLRPSSRLIGSHDDQKNEYNITLDVTVDEPVLGQTVSFKEDVRGWISFKSFVPENGISCANYYYTMLNGKLWRHHNESEDRNTFYKNDTSDGFTRSSINVLLNDQPGSVKSFHTLAYEGSQSKVDTNLQDTEYYNLVAKDGWYASHIETDKQEGSLNEFIEKEGKWFNYIKGVDSDISVNTDFGAFNIQGIGILSSISSSVLAFGYPVNASLQVGDVIYHKTPSDVSGFSVIDSSGITRYGVVESIAASTVTVTLDGTAPMAGDFILFAKNSTVNTSSLLGYYADVKLENNSKVKAEIFSIGSEVTESSK